MRRLAILAVLMAIGCGTDAEPTAKLIAPKALAPGSKVVIYAGEKYKEEMSVLVFLEDSSALIPVGTHAEIVSIPPPDEDGDRDIIVKITDGPAMGLAAKVDPGFLRPE